MLQNQTSTLVTVIMPTWNRAKFIVESVASVQRQTYPYWELLIIDDGSDDDTENIVAQLNDGRIKFYKAGRIGIGGAIKNIGLQKAAGELIAFIDSDDLWAPAKLEQQIAALQQYPDASFCLTGGYNFKEHGKAIDFFYPGKTGIKYGNVFLDFFDSGVAGFTQALLFKKTCVEKAGHFKEEKSFSDVDFILSLARNFNAVIIYAPLVYRRIHEVNYIHFTWEKSYEEGAAIIHANKIYLPVSLYKSALFRLYINYGEKYLSCGNPKKAVGKFFLAWRQKPISIIPLKKIGKAVLLRKPSLASSG